MCMHLHTKRNMFPGNQDKSHSTLLPGTRLALGSLICWVPCLSVEGSQCYIASCSLCPGHILQQHFCHFWVFAADKSVLMGPGLCYILLPQGPESPSWGTSSPDASAAIGPCGFCVPKFRWIWISEAQASREPFHSWSHVSVVPCSWLSVLSLYLSQLNPSSWGVPQKIKTSK
jgi:hypothetical protein